MKTYAGIFLLSLVLAAVLTPLVRRVALRLGAIDRPGRRKVHRREIPRLGGIAIYLAFFLPLLSFLFLSNTVSDLIAGNSQKILGLFLGSTIVLLVGIADDLKGLGPWTKLGLEVFASLIVYGMGIQVIRVTNPFGAPLELGAAAPVVTVLWIVGIANAINLIDGIDGLAAGVTAFAAIAIFICALAIGKVVSAVLVIGLGGAILGFLHHNFHPARIFMGDSGSLFVGFTLASLSILGSLKSPGVVAIAIPVLIFGVPIADTFLAAGRRLFRGRPLFRADAEHVHHTLLRQGFSQRQSSLILYSVTVFLGVVAFLITRIETRTIGIGFLVTGILGVILFRQILVARGHWRTRLSGLETLREARQALFSAEKALLSATEEKEIWEGIRSAVERLEYEGALWEVDLPSGGLAERSWGITSPTRGEWDLQISLPLSQGKGLLHVNRPAGHEIDFETRDTILVILSDLAAERLVNLLSSPRPAPDATGTPRQTPQAK